VNRPIRLCLLTMSSLLVCAPAAHADENLLGYVKGAETLPQGAKELYQWATLRSDKSVGSYDAVDYKTEFEYGVSDRFSASVAVKLMQLDTSGIRIDAYMPEDKKFGPRFSGLELGGKYNFLQPAIAPVGLSAYWSFDWSRLDPHSGQDKDTYSFESQLIAQKYFLEGQLIWAGNLNIEATYASRKPIDDLPEDFEWPTDPEMEIELGVGTGLSYRFIENWYIGAETLYEEEFETEVGQERWSVFAGPSLHYGGAKWWATLTWFHQLEGGGEAFPDQPSDDLHLIEKTKDEYRLKFGYNFG